MNFTFSALIHFGQWERLGLVLWGRRGWNDGRGRGYRPSLLSARTVDPCPVGNARARKSEVHVGSAPT